MKNLLAALSIAFLALCFSRPAVADAATMTTPPITPTATPATSAPTFAGCLANGRVCLGPQYTLGLSELNLTTKKFSAGFMPGIGYGATFAPGQWYQSAAGLFVQAKFGQDGPNQVIPSVVVHLLSYLTLGYGVALTETSGPMQVDQKLIFGIGN